MGKRILYWIAYVFGIVGTLSGFYFYYASVKEREPSIVFDPNRVTILDKELLKDKPITILDSTGKHISGNVVVLTFYFFNQGKESIKEENILEPLKLKIPKGIKLLDYNISQVSRDVADIKLLKYDTISKTIEIKFKILEKDDGFKVQLIYSGDIDADFEIVGTIEGSENVIDAEAEQKSRDSIMGYIFIGLTFVPYLILMPLFFNILFKPKFKKEESVKRPKTLSDLLTTKYTMVVKNKKNLKDQSTFDFTYAKILVITATLFLIIFSLSLFLSKTLLEKWFNPKYKYEVPVPNSILRKN